MESMGLLVGFLENRRLPGCFKHLLETLRASAFGAWVTALLFQPVAWRLGAAFRKPGVFGFTHAVCEARSRRQLPDFTDDGLTRGLWPAGFDDGAGDPLRKSTAGVSVETATACSCGSCLPAARQLRIRLRR
jgi:hypothetical protein